MNVKNAFTLPSGVRLKNRLICAPISTLDSSESGNLSDLEYQFYAQRTGDLGAIMIASSYVSYEGKAYEYGVGVSHDGHIKSLDKLAKTIQQQGTKAFLQIYHGGAMTQYLEGKTHHVCVSESSANLFEENNHFKELTKEKIEDIYIQYEKAVIRAIKSGFDGVEIHAANSYLPNQFLMESWNHRTDEYGGSIKNRLRFLEELLIRCQIIIDKHSVKPFALGVRLSLRDTFTTEKSNDDKMIKEAIFVFNHLDQLNLDYIHIASSNALEMIKIDDKNFLLLEILKEAAYRTPIIGNGNLLYSGEIEEVLDIVDLVSVCRPIILMPDWANNILNNKPVIFPNMADPNIKVDLAMPNKLWQSYKSSVDWYLYKDKESI